MTPPRSNLNERSNTVANRMAASAERLAVQVHHVGDGRVIDAGVRVRGGFEAGLMLARASVADLAEISIVPGRIGQIAIPVVAMHTSHPVAACMASQYAGWQIKLDGYFAMGSGPMRAAANKEELFQDIGCAEAPTCAVGVLETNELPPEPVIRLIADACGVSPNAVTLIVARTASVAGGVQIVARSIETALHKLHALSFDLHRVVGGFGTAPLPPVARDDMAAIGRTNDAVLYGAEVTIIVRGDDQSLMEVGAKLPSSESKDYGERFADIFKKHDHDFYRIDPMLFSPASICIQNIDSGCVHCFGCVNHDVLGRSFFEDESTDI